MKKPINYIFFVIIIVILYFLISNLLFRIDKTPRWCEIKHPDAVAAEKPFEIILKYHDISIACRLNAELIFTDKQGQYCGEKGSQNPIRIIYGKGETRFNFIITVNDLKKKDINSVRISLYRFELSKDVNESIYKSRRIGQTVSSENIPLVKLNPDGSFPEITKPSFSQVIEKAIKKGYWVKDAGDYTPEGWFITIAYFIICLLCFLFLIKLQKNHANIDKTYIRFWYILTIVVFILGINKQLDVQMLLADIGRTYSQAYGWYNTRRPFQIQFISFFTSLATGFVILIGYALKNIWRRVCLPLLGVSILFGFVIIKASSLHRLETFFGKTLGGFHLFGILELIGLGCIGLSAVFSYMNFMPNKKINN